MAQVTVLIMLTDRSAIADMNHNLGTKLFDCVFGLCHQHLNHFHLWILDVSSENECPQHSHGSGLTVTVTTMHDFYFYFICLFIYLFTYPTLFYFSIQFLFDHQFLMTESREIAGQMCSSKPGRLQSKIIM